MTNPGLAFFTFLIGFGMGITTHMLAGNAHNDGIYRSISDLGTAEEPVHRSEVVNLDPFPLPPCEPNRTSAVYILYGVPIPGGECDDLLNSITTLVKSNFPGRIRVIIDQMVNETIRENIDPKYKYLLDKIEFNVVSMPNLNGKELIPHSNKIRALQAAAFVYGNDSNECTVALDTDIYVHHRAPWNYLLSILQLNEVAVARDCEVFIEDVPEFLSLWMPNTGVLALRNTPRTRMVLSDWLDHFVPCNGTHVSTCTPGTDQYPFLQLAAKHAVRLHKLDHNWNCRLAQPEIQAGIEEFPVFSINILSNQENPTSEGALITTACGGIQKCHILHGHWLKFPK